jgi:hypothetical protein
MSTKMSGLKILDRFLRWVISYSLHVILRLLVVGDSEMSSVLSIKIGSSSLYAWSESCLAVSNATSFDHRLNFELTAAKDESFSSSDLVGSAFNFLWYLIMVRLMINMFRTRVERKESSRPRRAGSACSPEMPCSEQGYSASESRVSLDDDWIALFWRVISLISLLLRYNIDLTSLLLDRFSTGCTVTVGLKETFLLGFSAVDDSGGRCPR